MEHIRWQHISMLPCDQRGKMDYLLWVGDANGDAIIGVWNDRRDRWETPSGSIVDDLLSRNVTHFAEIRAPRADRGG